MKPHVIQSLIASAIAVLSSAAPAMAQENDWTLSFPENKAHFVTVQLEWAKKNPDWKPTKEELEALFDKADADKNGSLTEVEWKAQLESPKKEPAPNPPPSSPATNDWTLSFPENKAHFVTVQLEWAKKNPNWKPTKEELEALFDKADADKNGSLTEAEWKAQLESPKKEPAPNPPPSSPATNDWTLSFPENKAHFVTVQLEWAKKNPNWKPTKEELEALFDKADADKNGSLTEAEWKAQQ